MRSGAWRQGSAAAGWRGWMVFFPSSAQTHTHTRRPDLRALWLSGLKVKAMNVKSYLSPRSKAGHRGVMGWKVKTTACVTAACLAVLDITLCGCTNFGILTRFSFDNPDCTDPTITKGNIVKVNYFWPWYSLRKQQSCCFTWGFFDEGGWRPLQSAFSCACGKRMTRCMSGRNGVYLSNESI